jgi:hypothetical protein
MSYAVVYSEVMIAFGKAVFFYRSSFSRSASAKTKNKNGLKYHAAAGKYQLAADHRITRVT